MRLKKIIQNLLLFSSFLIIIYSYLYLPSQNKGYINIEKKEFETKKTTEDQNAKTIFQNTEYKSINNKGQIYTTKTKESYFYQKNPDYIYLTEPNSYTNLAMDKSTLSINSKSGFFDKEKKITTYIKEVVIKNKNYLINSETAQHFSEVNKIIISGNVIFKDFTLGLSHIMYCDTIEINTLTNDIVAFMNSKKNKVIAKKLK